MATGAVVDGLTNGQSYTFTVRATNTVATSGASSPSVPVVPQAAPPPPAPPDPRCQTSTLPAPPGEVVLANGEVRRRIDVPCQPLWGRVRVGFFIMDEEVDIPVLGVIADGDGRDFDPAMGPDDNRVYFEIDYTTGTGFIEANESCSDRTETDCTPAITLVNGVETITRSDGRISVRFSSSNSQAQGIPVIEFLSITGDFDITPQAGGGVCVTGTASRFPSIEAYYDQGSVTTELFTEPQSDWGPIFGLAFPDRGMEGCA